MSVSRVDAVGCLELGEGPHWDQATQTLYFVDIRGKSIHRYTPSTGEHRQATVGDQNVGFIIPVEGQKDKFVLGYGRKVITIDWDGTSDKISHMQVVEEVDEKGEEVHNRINDGKCNSMGKLWFGTMGPEPLNGQIAKEKGSLYSLDSNGKYVCHIRPVSISNGLCWNRDNTKFYYIDSLKLTVDEFDYSISSNTIGNCRPIFTFSKHGLEGLPDGMTIDADGNLWVAVWNGNKVLKIDPRKPETLLQTVAIPAKQITSVAFGGPQLDELYVTSASLTVDGVVLSAPDHGALYKVTGLGVKGVPMSKFNI